MRQESQRVRTGGESADVQPLEAGRPRGGQAQRWKKVVAEAVPPVLVFHSCANFLHIFCLQIFQAQSCASAIL